MTSGCDRRIRTSSLGYEPSKLPLLHQRDTEGVSSTPELYPNFSLSVTKVGTTRLTLFYTPIGREWRSIPPAFTGAPSATNYRGKNLLVGIAVFETTSEA